MKKNFLNVLMIVSLIINFSCQKDEESNKDLGSDILNLQIPSDNKDLRNQVVIETGIIESEPVEKVEFYVDGVLVNTDFDFPYEYNWDTKSTEDAEHIVKCVVFGNNRDKIEKEIKVSVFNKLFKLKVSEYLILKENNSEWEHWVYISDSKGKVLGTEKLTPGKTIVFDTPAGFSESTIDVNYFLRVNSNIDTEYEFSVLGIDTYRKMLPGSYFFGPASPTDNSTNYNAKLSITNVPTFDHFDLRLHSRNMYNLGFSSDPSMIALDLKFNKNPTSGIISFKNESEGIPMYRWLENIQHENSYTLSFEDFKPMENKETVAFPPSSFYQYSIMGEKEGEGSINLFSTSNGTSTHVSSFEVITPINNLKKTYYFTCVDEDGAIRTSHQGEIKKKYEKPSWSINVTNNSKENFTAKPTGAFDYLQTTFYYSEPMNVLFWNMYSVMDSQEINFAVPEMPVEIITAYPTFLKSSLKYSGTSLYNLEQISTSSEYFELMKDIWNINWNNYQTLDVRAKDFSNGRMDRSLRKRLNYNSPIKGLHPVHHVLPSLN